VGKTHKSACCPQVHERVIQSEERDTLTYLRHDNTHDDAHTKYSDKDTLLPPGTRQSNSIILVLVSFAVHWSILTHIMYHRNTQWARLTPSGAAPRRTHARAHAHTHTHTHTRRTRATTAVSTIPRIPQAQARVCGMLVETARYRSPAVRTQVRVSRLRPHAGKMSGLSSSRIDYCSHLRVINASHRCESYGIKKKRSHVACTRGVVFANCVANLYL